MIKTVRYVPFPQAKNWGDKIEVFKILNNFYKINPHIIFTMNKTAITRGNQMKIKVWRCNTIAR